MRLGDRPLRLTARADRTRPGRRAVRAGFPREFPPDSHDRPPRHHPPPPGRRRPGTKNRIHATALGVDSRLTGCGAGQSVGDGKPAADQKPASFYTFKTTSLDGKPVDLSQYKGKVTLVVNVASRCGYTPQYADLEKLYEAYKD